MVLANHAIRLFQRMGQRPDDYRYTSYPEICSRKVACIDSSSRIAIYQSLGSQAFRSNSAVSKMLGLMLAHGMPLDLLNGQRIDVDRSLSWSNDKEYHHFFPQAYLVRRRVPASRANVVGNIVLLTSKSNIDIRDAAPGEYLNEIIRREGRERLEERLTSNLVPMEALEPALADNYDEFLKLRAHHLHGVAQKLAGAEKTKVVDAEEVDDSDEDPTE